MNIGKFIGKMETNLAEKSLDSGNMVIKDLLYQVQETLQYMQFKKLNH